MKKRIHRCFLHLVIFIRRTCTCIYNSDCGTGFGTYCSLACSILLFSEEWKSLEAQTELLHLHYAWRTQYNPVNRMSHTYRVVLWLITRGSKKFHGSRQWAGWADVESSGVHSGSTVHWRSCFIQTTREGLSQVANPGPASSPYLVCRCTLTFEPGEENCNKNICFCVTGM